MSSKPKVYDPNAGARASLLKKPPEVVQPANISSGLGNINYSPDSNVFSVNSNTNAQDSANAAAAKNAFANQIGMVQDPAAGMQQARDTYAAMAIPQWQRQHDIDMGATIAGLGHQYQSTYGQLTAAKKAEDEALSRAQLQNDIYDRGNTYFNQQVQNAGALGQTANQAQATYQLPYAGLLDQLTAASNAINNYNTAVGNNYRAQLGGTAAPQVTQQGQSFTQGLANVGSAAANTGKLLFG